MVARNTNVPFKGRIQKRKTYHLQIITFRLQRAAGPYRSAITGCEQSQQTLLLDHLVGVGEQRGRHSDAERVGRLEIDNQLELGRRLHRKVRGFLALEDAIDVAGRSPVFGRGNPARRRSARRREL
jgi:hypothetical protein